MEANKAERMERITKLMEYIREQASFNGVILLAEQGIPLVCDAIGTAEFNSTGTRPLTTESVFELASVSKPITALGIIRLQQLGQLHWEDLVSNWLPELPYPGITVRHLLSHTSGLPDYMELFAKEWNPAGYATNNDVLNLLQLHRPDPLFSPNDSWMYSNTGYIMLAILIERISGQSFADFLYEQIFQRLGMTRTRVFNSRVDPDAIPEDYAFGYVYRVDRGGLVMPDEVPELNYVHYLDGLQGDGMVNSTVRDLLTLDRALYDDNFINPQLRQLMLSPAVLNNGETFDYGFGWLMEQQDRLGKVMYHSGGWPGYATMFKRYIDHDFTMIILQNGEREVAYTQQLIQCFEHIIAGEPFEAPRPAVIPAIISIAPEEYEPLLGKYGFSDGQGTAMIVEVFVMQDQLYMKLANEMVLLLLPISSVRFYEQQTATELEFIGAETGKSSRLIWHEPEHQNVAERMA